MQIGAGEVKGAKAGGCYAVSHGLREVPTNVGTIQSNANGWVVAA